MEQPKVTHTIIQGFDGNFEQYPLLGIDGLCFIGGDSKKLASFLLV